MLLKLLNKLRNFRLFGLLKFEDLYVVAVYAVLSGWAIIHEEILLLKILAALLVIILLLFAWAARLVKGHEDETRDLLNSMLDNSTRAREAHEQYLESVRLYRNVIGVYLRDTAVRIENGLPMSADDIAAMRAIANNLIREKEAQETKEKPDDQPERGSATSDAGAPESEGLPPQT